MKKFILLLVICAVGREVYAQRCLDINILSLTGHLQAPGDAASCYNECATTTNDHGQKVISNYGTRDTQLDELIKQKMQEFTNASVSGMGSGPSASQVQDYKAMAAKMKEMTPDQQKAYAMQIAQQMQSSRSTAQMENPAAARIVGTNQTNVMQLKQLGDEFAAKLRALKGQEKTERDAVKTPDYSKCPGVDKTGMPACGCVNGLDGKYWQQIVAIENKYNSQKTALLQSYLPRYKTLIGTIEDNIAKVHYGDDLKTANYKKILFSQQSSTFAAAFDIPSVVINDIRRTGSDAYVNKVNSDAGVYNLSCSHQK
ncbi:MAG TPA: hypothetical protein VIM89_02820 [Mucilaginibacter sp.]